MTEEAKGAEGLYSTTEPVIMAFPNLFEAKAFERKGRAVGDPKYSANFVFEKDSADLKAMMLLALKVAKAKFPGKDIRAEVAAGNFVMPFTDGTKLADKRKAKSGKDDGDYQRGKCVIAARSKYPPKLSGFENNKVADYDETTVIPAKKKFFSGAKVLVQFNFVPYDPVGDNGKPGVTAYLNSVLSTGKGNRISGAPPASEVFKGYIGSASEEDPTVGADNTLDDDLPF